MRNRNELADQLDRYICVCVWISLIRPTEPECVRAEYARLLYAYRFLQRPADFRPAPEALESRASMDFARSGSKGGRQVAAASLHDS